MKRLRNVAFAALLLVAFVGIAWRLFSPRLIERLRVTIAAELASALSTDAEIGALSVALSPLGAGVESVALGPNGEWLRFKDLEIRLLPVASIEQRRPVVEVEADGVWIDIARLTGTKPKEEEPSKERGSVLAFRVRKVRLTDAKVRVPIAEHPLDVSIARLNGEIENDREGRIALQAAGEGVRFERQEARLDLDSLVLDGGWTKDGPVVRDLEAHGDGIEIEGAEDDFGDPSRHRVHADIDLARIAGFDETLRGLEGRLRVVALLSGALDDPTVEASFSARGLGVRNEPIGDLRGRIGRRDDRVEIERASLRGFGGAANGKGSLAIGGKQKFDLRTQWRRLDAGRIAALAGAHGVPEIRLGGHADITGKLNPFSLDGDGKGRLRRAGAAAPVDWELDAQTNGEVNRLRLVATQEKGNRVEADVTLGPADALGGTLEASVADTAAVWDIAGIEDPTHATGTFTLSSKLSGTTADPRFAGHIGGQRLKVQGSEVERMEGGFEADLRHVRADGVRLAVAGGTVDVNGVFGIDPAVENAWEVRVDRLDVGIVAAIASGWSGTSLPLSGGTLSAAFSGRGPWKTATVNGNLQARGFAVAGEPFEALDATVGAHLPSWSLDAEVLHRQGESLTAHGEGEGVGQIAARVESTAWSLSKLASTTGSEMGGSVRVGGSVRGPLKALDGGFEVAAAGVFIDRRQLGDIHAAIGVAAGNWNVDARLLDGAVQVTGNLLDEGRYSLDAQWAEADFGPLAQPDGNLRIGSTGTLRASGRTDAPLAVDGDLTVPTLEVASGGYRVAAEEPIRLAAKAGTFTIESMRMVGKNGTLVASGTFTTGGAVNVEIDGKGSLRLLETLGKPVESSRGQFDLTMKIDRPLQGASRLDGRLSLSDAALDVGLPFGPTETAAEIRFAGSRIEIEQLAGRIGGGTFMVGGVADLAHGPDLTWQVREMSTGMVPSVEHELSGDGTLRGSWNELTVAGRIDILRALYDKRIEISSFLPSFKRDLKPAPDTESDKPKTVVHLDLRVVASDELYIDNNFARVEAAADLRVTGEASNPRLGGQVQALSGEVFFKDRTFHITTAVVDFRPEIGFVASLNITAETDIETTDGTYTVRLQVTGTTDKPRVTMTSDDPSLTQNDVATLIAFGKTVAQLQEEGGGVAVSDVLLLAPGGYSEKVEKKTASLLRLDRVDIEPTFSRTTGEFEPQLVLGKNFGDNFSTSLTATFGATQSQTLRATYLLTPSFSLLATFEPESQNRDQAFGGGLRFRRTFRDTPGISLLELGNHGSTKDAPP